MRSWADDYANFLRVDDLGNEIIIEYREQKKDVAEDNNPDKPPKELRIEELIQELESFTQYINRLPEHELKSPVSQSEMAIFMLIVTAILKKGLLPNDNT